MELDDDCEIDSPITILLLSFRVLTTLVAGDCSTLRESLILPSAGSRPKYFTCIKEANLPLQLHSTMINIQIRRYLHLYGAKKPNE